MAVRSCILYCALRFSFHFFHQLHFPLFGPVYPSFFLRMYLKSRKYGLFLQTQRDFALKSLGQYRIILSADTASEVRQLLSQKRRSQSARGFCPRSTMRVPQPDIIEHFGNADAGPQLPERCLSRKAGIVRCCLGKKVVQDLISGGLHCLWGRVNPLRRTPQLAAIFGRRNAV